MIFSNNLVHIQLHMQAVRQCQTHANNNGATQEGVMFELTMQLLNILHWNIKFIICKKVPEGA